MAISDTQPPILDEIERAESYLVCGMFDEATSLASSIIRELLEKQGGVSENYENERDDILESAGMVLVQSWKQLGRTPDILKELTLLFGSVKAIPIQVFVTGVCFQMSETLSSTVQGFLEEFLNNWRYIDGRYFPLSVSVASESAAQGSSIRFSIEADSYFEVVELYVIAFLAMSIKDIDLAISWVEKAILPMEKRQELLRRLHSMNSSKVTSSSKTSVSYRLHEDYGEKSEQKPYNRSHTEARGVSDRAHTAKEEILKLSRQRVPCTSWFPAINLKFGNTRLVVPSGRLLLASLLLLLCYLTRKKQAALKRVLAKKVRSMKNAVLDLWQLAFSYQVNPLAAVQPLPTAMSGSRG